MAYLSNKPGDGDLTPIERLLLAEIADLGDPLQYLRVDITGTGLEYTSFGFFSGATTPVQITTTNGDTASILLYDSKPIVGGIGDFTGIDFGKNAYGIDNVLGQIRTYVTDDGLDAVSSKMVFSTISNDSLTDNLIIKKGNVFVGGNDSFIVIDNESQGNLGVLNSLEVQGNSLILGSSNSGQSILTLVSSSSQSIISWDGENAGMVLDASGGTISQNILLNPVSGNVGIFRNDALYKLDMIGDQRITTVLIPGTGNITDDGDGNITGSGTLFLAELKQGDRIYIPDTGEYTEVINIDGDEFMFVYPPTIANGNVFQYAKNPLEIFTDNDEPILQIGAARTVHIGMDGGATTRNTLIFRNGGYGDPVGNGETNSHLVSPGDKIVLFNNDADLKASIGIASPSSGAGLYLACSGSAYGNIRFFTGDTNGVAPIERAKITAAGVFEIYVDTTIDGQTTLDTGLTGILRADSGVVSVDSTVIAANYTPTSTNVTNITSSTPNNAGYQRIGSIVTVFGSIAVTETLAVASQVDISLPVASNLGSTTDLYGLGNSDAAIANNIIIKANTANDRASIFFTALSVGGNGTIYYSFQYKII